MFKSASSWLPAGLRPVRGIKNKNMAVCVSECQEDSGVWEFARDVRDFKGNEYFKRFRKFVCKPPLCTSLL